MDHRFEPCRVYQEPAETTRLNAPVEGHSWRQCYFCDKLTEIEALQQHILQSHNQTGHCPVCSVLQTI